MSIANLKKPVLYSTMTLMAYNINKTYYNDKHYMWCTPYFGTNTDSPLFTVPPSSSPLEIYNSLKNDVRMGDLHSAKINMNRIGIKHGASLNMSLGNIDREQHDEIVEISNATDLNLFKPLLCVISRLEAVPYFKKVNIKDKANPLSHEYILSNLPETVFDIIRFD